MGAYYQLLTPGIPELGGWVYMGPYDMQAYWYEFTGIVTNATPTDAYRGAGRPEATYVLERAVDALARKVGKDPAEVRRHHRSCRSSSRRRTAISGLNVDSGDVRGDVRQGARARRLRRRCARSSRRRREQGDLKQLGIGLSSYIEMCGLAPSNILGALRYAAGGWDACTVQCLPDGKVGPEDRHLAARAGPRDHVGADRGRHARRHARRHRGAPRRHRGGAARHGHLREPERVGRRDGPALRAGEDQGQGADARGARARGVRGRPRVRRRDVHA